MLKLRKIGKSDNNETNGLAELLQVSGESVRCFGSNEDGNEDGNKKSVCQVGDGVSPRCQPSFGNEVPKHSSVR